jgi:hypothetical protein
VACDFSPARFFGIASLEFPPLQHISALKSTVRPLCLSAGLDRGPA